MTGKEALEVLLQTHFPESNIINPQDQCHLQNPINMNQRATRGDWQTSNMIINYSRISGQLAYLMPINLLVLMGYFLLYCSRVKKTLYQYWAGCIGPICQLDMCQRSGSVSKWSSYRKLGKIPMLRLRHLDQLAYHLSC
jgi:hypothetical protein